MKTPKTSVSEQMTVEPEETVLLLPGKLFFVEEILLEQEDSSSLIQELAELTLEGVSPFPLEQLLWGYRVSQKEQKVLIYAALRERLEGLGYQELHRYQQVYPDFLLLDQVDDAGSGRLLLSRHGWSAKIGGQWIFGEAGESVDTEENDESRIQRVLAEAKGVGEQAGLEAGLVETATIFTEVQAGFNEHRVLGFQYRTGAEGEERSATLGADQVWSADLRAEGFKLREAKERGRTLLFWRALKGIAAAAVLLLLLEVLRLVGGVWVEQRQAQIAEQDSSVQRIISQNTLTHRLDRFATDKMKPFLMLAIVHQPLPESIFLTSVETPGSDQIVVEGIGTRVNVVTNYVTALAALPWVNEVQQEIRGTVQGRVTFSLTAEIPEPEAAFLNPSEVALQD